MIKHSIFNSIRSNNVVHKAKYGNMILCCDNGSWRYDVYSQYKHSRKEKRKTDTSGIKWDFIQDVKHELISDLEKYFPYPVISVRKAEGDDCIAVITKLINFKESTEESDIFGDADKEKILIISSDNDHLQLQSFGKHIKQWSPMMKKLVIPPKSLSESMIEKIVKGESSDGIPNIKSSDNVFVDKIRQKPIGQKYLDNFFASSNPIDICLTEDEKVNFKRNELLVSYEKIPQAIQDAIITCYNEQSTKKHSKMNFYNYLSSNGMGNLLAQIHDFY